MSRVWLLAAALFVTSATYGTTQDVDAEPSTDGSSSNPFAGASVAVSTEFDSVEVSHCPSATVCTCADQCCGHGDLRTREHLTNGFWGLQPALAEHGIVYDAELTQFYQGVANGGLEQTFKYGGKLDQFVAKIKLQHGPQLRLSQRVPGRRRRKDKPRCRGGPGDRGKLRRQRAAEPGQREA